MTPDDWQLAWRLLPGATLETLYMVATSALLATLIGLPIGVLLYLTDKGRLKERAIVYKLTSAIANMGRSFPFAILMVALIPFTRWVVGTSLGTTASIVPLSLAAAAFMARVIENSLSDVDHGVVDAAVVIGSKPLQIVHKVLLPEALPGIVSGITLTWINLIGYSAMAGLMGGGGLGKVAIQYGYQRFNSFLMFITVLLLIVIVQLTQWLGQAIVKAINARRGKEKSCSE